MIKKYWFEFILVAIFIFSVGIMVGTILYSDKIETLENEVVEAYDKGYKDGENHAIYHFMEDYYDILLENAILKERLKNQPKNEAYVQQILDDLELVIELMQHYYENNITSHSFGDWLQINYPALYARIESYF